MLPYGLAVSRSLSCSLFSRLAGRRLASRSYWVILLCMKTAISVADPIFQAGERLAKRLGISRSHLYSKALLEYVERHDEDAITRRLNEVYATESSEPDPVITKIAAHSLPKESWK
jgi:predicted transcriptional regulator